MNPDFTKDNGLIPVIVQHYTNGQVLMLGYMNRQAYTKTQQEKRVTFYSRSKQRLWTKGESSGNYLEVHTMYLDCDQDAILIKANPMGPTCHTGTNSCFNHDEATPFIYDLEQTIAARIQNKDSASYTSTLVSSGLNKVAQKVGEEAVELVIEAKDNNMDLFLNEAADLMYHYLVLLQAKGTNLEAVEAILRARAK